MCDDVTARHTFATTATLTNGVPIETVSKMLGHKDPQDNVAVCKDFGSESE